MTALRDEETQKRGIVVVVYNVGPKRFIPGDFVMMQRFHAVREVLPQRIVGAHYCFDDDSIRPIVWAMRLLLPKRVRTRFRPHFGT